MTKVTLTVAAPESDRDDANQLAACLGWLEGWVPKEWDNAFLSQYQDSEGQLYRVMSCPVETSFVYRAKDTRNIDRPEEDTENVVNLSAARRAQDKLVMWKSEDDTGTPPVATPDSIVGLVGVPGAKALSYLGLSALSADFP